MISPIRILLFFLKVFVLLVVTAMIKSQIPELKYDLGTKEPVSIESLADLSTLDFDRSLFVSVRGKPDLSKAATFAKHGVRYTYFLLNGYNDKLVVRSPETPNEEWNNIDLHLGRLRPYHRMPFSQSVRAGFAQLFDVTIPDDAYSLSRDDVPRLSGWSVGAVIFAVILWCVLAYFFFVHSRLCIVRKITTASGDRSPPHHAQPEPTGDQPRDDRSEANQDS